MAVAAGYLLAMARAAAERYGLPVALVYAIVEQESNWSPQAYNPEGSGDNGSYGLMQVRLSTARALGYVGAPEGLFDAYRSLDLGCKYLAELASSAARHGWRMDSAVSAYNGGPSSDRPGDGTRGVKKQGKCTGGLRDPFCNQVYVNQVMDRWARYAAELAEDDPRPGDGTGSPIVPLAIAALAWVALWRVL